MWWGTHVEGSDAWWCYCTSPEPSWSSMCPQPPLSWGSMGSLTLPACSSSPGDLLRCAVGLGQPDSLAGVWALGRCLRGFWQCYVAKRSIHEQQSLFHIMDTVFFCTYISWGERGTVTSRGSLYASCSSSISPGECWVQQPEPLEISQIVLNVVFIFCYCEEQMLSISTHFIYWISNQSLIFFILTILPTPPKPSSFQATDLLI